jgi:hypothetical protein
VSGRCSNLVRCALLLPALGAALHAQLGPDPDFTQTWPFCAMRSLASEGGPEIDDLIVTGQGGGRLALSMTSEATPTEPVPWDEPAVNPIPTQGFVYDVKMTADHVAMANGIGGVVVYDRTSSPPLAQQFSFPVLDDADNKHDARAIDIVESVPFEGTPHDFVFVGTNDIDADGRVFVYAINQQGVISKLDEFVVGAPVLSIEASAGILANHLVVLVGLIDGSGSFVGGVRGSLLRLDFPLLDPPPIHLQLSGALDAWGKYGVPPNQKFTVIRDILLDETVSPPRAYVAGLSRGVFALDVPSWGGLYEVVAPLWPLHPAQSVQAPARAHGLALHKLGGQAILAVAFGPRLNSNLQTWGSCNQISVGDDSEGLPVPDDRQGIWLWNLLNLVDTDADQVADPLGKMITANAPNQYQLTSGPWDLSIRPASPTVFYIDAALDHHGVQVVQADKTTAGTWRLVRTEAWNMLDEQTTSSMDDLLERDGVLYAGGEITLSAYDLAQPDPLAQPTEVVPAGGVLLTAFPSLGDPAVLYAGGQGEGAVCYDLANKFQPAVHEGTSGKDHILNTGGQVITPIAFRYEPPGGTVEHWVIAINNKMKDRVTGQLGGENGGVTIFNVGSTTTPGVDGHAPPVVEYSYEADLPAFPGGPHDNTPEGDGLFVGGYALNLTALGPHSHPQFVIYVTYGPFDDELNDGLMTLLGDYNPDQDTFTLDQMPDSPKLPITLEPGYLPTTQVARLTYDATTDRLYAAYGCAGVAMYSVADKKHPQLLGYGHILSEPGLPGISEASAIEVIPAPGGRAIVTLLRRGVLVLDASTGGTFASAPPVGWHLSRFNANDLLLTTPALGEPDSVFWMADGFAGVHRVVFNDL